MLLQFLATSLDGNLLTDKVSIGGSDARVSSAPNGIGRHNAYEIDSSLTRNDKYFGDNFSMNGTLYEQMFSVADRVNNGVMNIESQAEFRNLRYQDSKARNPNSSSSRSASSSLAQTTSHGVSSHRPARTGPWSRRLASRSPRSTVRRTRATATPGSTSPSASPMTGTARLSSTPSRRLSPMPSSRSPTPLHTARRSPSASRRTRPRTRTTSPAPSSRSPPPRSPPPSSASPSLDLCSRVFTRASPSSSARFERQSRSRAVVGNHLL